MANRAEGEDKTIEFQGIASIKPENSQESLGVCVKTFFTKLGFSQKVDGDWDDGNSVDYESDIGFDASFLVKTNELTIRQIFSKKEIQPINLIYGFVIKSETDLMMLFSRLTIFNRRFQTTYYRET